MTLTSGTSNELASGDVNVKSGTAKTASGTLTLFTGDSQNGPSGTVSISSGKGAGLPNGQAGDNQRVFES